MRQLTEPGQQLRLEQSDPIPILGPSRSHVERHHAARIEAAVDDGEVVVAAEQQRGGADEGDTQRDLCQHEPLLETIAASGDASRSHRHHLLQITPRSNDGGDDADDDRREKRRDRGERKRAPVERQLVHCVAWPSGSPGIIRTRPIAIATPRPAPRAPMIRPSRQTMAIARPLEAPSAARTAARGRAAHLHQREPGNVRDRDQPERADRREDEHEPAPRSCRSEPL